MELTVKDLLKIRTAAIKLDIKDWETKPTVDTLYDIACTLCILEVEIVTPQFIMDKIDQYLKDCIDGPA